MFILCFGAFTQYSVYEFAPSSPENEVREKLRLRNNRICLKPQRIDCGQTGGQYR